MRSAKILIAEKMDRISELPSNVMDCIFEAMTIRDAARTSILSRKWRYKRASYPKLVFDKNFFEEIKTKYKKSLHYEFPKAINKALLVHIIPILEFSLHIPNIPSDIGSEIDQWMLFLSRNGIKELELQNSNPSIYILPSCLFSCSSLRRLKVTNCIVKPPHAYGGFRYLIYLSLEEVSFSAGMSATLLRNAPVLKSLIIINCVGIEHHAILVPTLTYFCMAESGIVDWQWFERNKELRTVYVKLGINVKNVVKNMNMIKFLKDIPNVTTLWVDGFSLKYLGADSPPQPLIPSPAYLPFLTWVRLLDFAVDNLDQIAPAYLLLQSCPKLRTLELDFATSTDNVTHLVEGYLEPSDCMNLSLDMLQTVKIRYFKGRKTELLIIKFLLLHSTCLKRMIIEQSAAVDESNGFKIFRDLLRFSRASSSAEIILSPIPAK